jgi:hypothetical protein
VGHQPGAYGDERGEPDRAGHRAGQQAARADGLGGQQGEGGEVQADVDS